jgi:hypothetical protein
VLPLALDLPPFACCSRSRPRLPRFTQTHPEDAAATESYKSQQQLTRCLTWIRTRPLPGPGISATWPAPKKVLADQLSRNCHENTMPTVRSGPKLKALGGRVPHQSLRREPETVMLPLRKPTEPRHGFHLYAFFPASTRSPKFLKTKTRWFWL